MRKIMVYECEYCGYYKKTKKNVINHEKRCFLNPDTRSCATCLYYPGMSDLEYKCGGGVEMNGKLKTQCPAHVWYEKYLDALEMLSEKENRQYSHAEILEAMKLSLS